MRTESGRLIVRRMSQDWKVDENVICVLWTNIMCKCVRRRKTMRVVSNSKRTELGLETGWDVTAFQHSQAISCFENFTISEKDWRRKLKI